jgi:16S rRNA (cytosine967-C5)-methyltransferase
MATSPSLPLARLLEATAHVVRGVRDGRSLNEALTQVPAAARAGTQALSFQTLRRLGVALALRQQLAARVPRGDIDALLLTALALLSLPTNDAPYTAHTLVDQAVVAARQMQTASSGFVNAVLRRFLRERDTAMAKALQDPVAKHNHPTWWIDRLRRDWPQDWQGLLAQAQHAPPMTLRVNLQRTSVPAYLQALDAAGLRAERLHLPLAHALFADTADTPNLDNTPNSVNTTSKALADANRADPSPTIVLHQPCPVHQLPGFADGLVAVQDAAAQLAAPLLMRGLRRGAALRVLDACAAPGGKTAHLLSLDPRLRVTALDSDPQRLERVRDNLARLGGHADVIAGDAGDPTTWWNGEPFDAVLLDAPCTASGIVRRHPDIPWLRRASDVDQLARTQSRLLDALWPLVAPGGILVYASCSLFKAEGVQQIDAFLQRVGPNHVRLDRASPGHLRPLPDNQGAAAHDGFFYARLEKLGA